MVSSNDIAVVIAVGCGSDYSCEGVLVGAHFGSISQNKVQPVCNTFFSCQCLMQANMRYVNVRGLLRELREYVEATYIRAVFLLGGERER